MNTPALVLLLFVAAALAAYANVVDTYFLSDDFAQIGRVLTGDLSVVWGREHGGFFRPVFILSYAIDAALWGRRPFGFHLTNVLLHALNCFLIFLLARQLFEDSNIISERRRDTAALLAGLLFLLHPSHTEAVSWISGRADVLATLFGLSSLLFYLSLSRAPRLASRALSLVLSLLCFALALLSKEAAAFVPLAVFLLGARRDFGRGPRRALVNGARHAAPFVLVLAAYVVARTAVLGSLVGGYGAEHHLNFTHSMIVSQLLRFPLRAIFPALALSRATFLESRLLSPVLIVTGVLVVITAALALSRASARQRLTAFLRRNTFLWTLAALFLCALLPAINLRIDVFTTHGERYLYFPSAFFCVALAHVLLNSMKRRRLALAAVSCVIIFYAASLWLTNGRWAATARVSRSIVSDLAAQSGGGTVLVLNLPDNHDGAHLFRNGLPEAMLWFSDEVKLTDVRVLAWHGLRSAGGGAELSEDSEGTFTLKLTDEGDVFGRINEGITHVEVVERGERQLRLRLFNNEVDGRKPVDVFYFGGGRMVKLRSVR